MAIEFTVVCGEGWPAKSGLMDRTDPYVVVTAPDGQTFKTTVKKNAKDKAEWNESHRFEGLPENFNIEVKDHDLGKDDKLAHGVCYIGAHTVGYEHFGWIPLEGKHCKDAKVQVKYTISS